MNSYSCSLDSVYVFLLGLPCSSVCKESACSAGDLGLIPGLVRSPGEGNGNPLQCSCLENPMDRGAWRATVHGSQDSDTNHHHRVFVLVIVYPFLITVFWKLFKLK